MYFPNRVHPSLKKKLLPLFFMGLCLLIPLAATAHNVTIFAWVEGDMVYTESKFSGGRKAKEALIEVQDMSGKKLLEGKTDQNGEFSFKLPHKETLKIILKAGMGHGNEWILTAEEIAEAQADGEAETSSPSPPPSPQADPALSSSVTPKSNASPTEIQASLEAALDKKLAPVLKKLSHLEAKQKEKTGATEIIGGIGYILGLIGLAAYIHFKQKLKAISQ